MTFNPFLRKSLLELLGIALISGSLAFGINFVRQKPLDLTGPVPIPAEPADIEKRPEALAGVREISLDEAIDHFRRGTALFVDARSTEDYQEGHIDGAISIPDQRFDDYIGPFLAANPPETLLITYCGGEACTLSQNLAEKLILAGFDRVLHLRDGWGEWVRNGLPVSRGSY